MLVSGYFTALLHECETCYRPSHKDHIFFLVAGFRPTEFKYAPRMGFCSRVVTFLNTMCHAGGEPLTYAWLPFWANRSTFV